MGTSSTNKRFYNRIKTGSGGAFIRVNNFECDTIMAAEPISASTGYVITVGTVTIAGTLFGMHFDALMFGLFGGLIMLSRISPKTRLEAFTTLITSVILAGVMAPILAAWTSETFTFAQKVKEDVMREAAALVIGGGWLTVLPTAWEAAKSWIGSKFGGTKQ